MNYHPIFSHLSKRHLSILAERLFKGLCRFMPFLAKKFPVPHNYPPKKPVWKANAE